MATILRKLRTGCGLFATLAVFGWCVVARFGKTGRRILGFCSLTFYVNEYGVGPALPPVMLKVFAWRTKCTGQIACLSHSLRLGSEAFESSHGGL